MGKEQKELRAGEGLNKPGFKRASCVAPAGEARARHSPSPRTAKVRTVITKPDAAMSGFQLKVGSRPGQSQRQRSFEAPINYRELPTPIRGVSVGSAGAQRAPSAQAGRWRSLYGFLNAAEIIVHDVERDGRNMIIKLLREAIGKPGEPARAQAEGKVLPLDVTDRKRTARDRAYYLTAYSYYLSRGTAGHRPWLGWLRCRFTMTPMPPAEAALAATGAFPVLLDRRARHVAVGTEHAAIARLWLETASAGLAVIEELAGVRRHPFNSLMAALGTGQSRFQLHPFSIPKFSN
jgi:hypothetical protein